MTEQEAPPDGQSLCTACGLCCKGVWFTSAGLDPEELPQARAIGLEVVQKGDKSLFVQPCPKHVNGCCSVYGNWRPKVCKSFTCALLDRFLAREISKEKALSHVAAAGEMAERVMAETGPVEGGLLSDAFMARLTAQWEPGNANQLSAESRMDGVALRVFFDSHFKKTAPAAPPTEVNGSA